MPAEVLKARWFWFARWCCKCFCMLFFHLRTYDRDNVPEKGAFILVTNHQSFMDPIFCVGPLRRPAHFLARDTLFKNRFFGPLISSVYSIPLKRDQADLTAMRTVIELLKKGRGLCLFPEGTRTQDGRIAPLKPGFGLLARRGRAAIVPVVIDGAYEAWPRTQKLFTPGKLVTVHYGRPISYDELKGVDDEQLAKIITDTMRNMQNQIRLKNGRLPFDYTKDVVGASLG
jgi:1-acyl-sn-glycerol-3-phosphate acyltransferase